MHISWLGTTALRIQTKPVDKDIVIVIDPYKPGQGEFPRNLAPDIALFTRGEDNAITLSGNPFVLATAGECDIQGVLVTSVEGHAAGHTMLRIDAEQLSLAHLGLLNKPLTDREKEAMGDIDILCIPVGGADGYDAEQAVKIVNELEPRIVISMAFKSENDPNADPVQTFLKEMGVTNGGNPETKVIIKKKDLPEEETRVIVLAKE